MEFVHRESNGGFYYTNMPIYDLYCPIWYNFPQLSCVNCGTSDAESVSSSDDNDQDTTWSTSTQEEKTVTMQELKLEPEHKHSGFLHDNLDILPHCKAALDAAINSFNKAVVQQYFDDPMRMYITDTKMHIGNFCHVHVTSWKLFSAKELDTLCFEMTCAFADGWGEYFEHQTHNGYSLSFFTDDPMWYMGGTLLPTRNITNLHHIG